MFRNEVAASVARSAGWRVDGEAVRDQGTGHDDLPDATCKCVIQSGTERGFVLVSSAAAPGMVARCAHNIGQVAARLPEGLAATVLPPLAVGEIGGRSAAIWRWHRPVTAANPLVRRAWLRWHRAALLDWAHDVMAAGRAEADGEVVAVRFQSMLERAATDDGYDPALREDARRALARLDSGRWARLFTTLQHGDLWAGNLLMGDGETAPFFVVDWGGAQVSGYPVFDLARLSMSLGLPPETTRRVARRFADALDCAPEDLIGYAVASLAELSTRLEHFPPARFRAMARDVHRHVREIAA